MKNGKHGKYLDGHAMFPFRLDMLLSCIRHEHERKTHNRFYLLRQANTVFRFHSGSFGVFQSAKPASSCPSQRCLMMTLNNKAFRLEFFIGEYDDD